MKKAIISSLGVGLILAFAIEAYALNPQADNWFGVGLNLPSGEGAEVAGPGALPYYYVGQSFDVDLLINSNASTAANLKMSYTPQLLDVNTVNGGTYYNTWQGQSYTLDGTILSTGYNFPVVDSQGLGNFGSVNLTALQPTVDSSNWNAANLSIQFSGAGESTDSNIAKAGQDYLEQVTDFSFYLLADEKAPYVKNTNPEPDIEGFPVDANLSYEVWDSLNGIGDDSGYGTGIDTGFTGLAVSLQNPAGEFIDFTNYLTHQCGGIDDHQFCQVAISPPALTNFSGDSRKLNYATYYQLVISGYKDLASSNQSQLGAKDGPNEMIEQRFAFVTAPDLVKPAISSVNPEPNSIEQPLNRLISFNVTDRESYPTGYSGIGLNPSTCRVEVIQAGASTTYSPSSSELNYVNIDYGYQYTLNLPNDFAANELVSVRIYNCTDSAGNVMSDYSFEFTTVQNPSADSDGDGVVDAVDNCPGVATGNEVDSDGDGVPDACDSDQDNDGINDATDNCPSNVNANQSDLDGDGQGDACDIDIDEDGFENDVDNCPYLSNASQQNLDEDEHGDVCDEDLDGDGILNDNDNCPSNVNANQSDLDGDGQGDACDIDIDEDGFENDVDNCPFVANADQQDDDGDNVGNVCDLNAGNKHFSILARLQRRLDDQSAEGFLSFYNKGLGNIAYEDVVSLDKNGAADYETDALDTGEYDALLKIQNYLGRIIRGIKIIPSNDTLFLDYTFGNVAELIAGDFSGDNRINSYDMATLLFHYGMQGDHFTDLNNDKKTSSADLALLILNYFKTGDSF